MTAAEVMKGKRVIVTAVASAAILAFGLGIMLTLKSFRKPPAEASPTERPLRVEGVVLKPEDVPVTITGYGEVRARDVVAIAPEVSGKIVEIRPNLELGAVIPRGEKLFVIDQRDYRAQVQESRAAVAQAKTSVQQLQTQYSNDQERLKTLRRSRDLAQEEFERVKQLFEVDQVGTRSGVDAAERAYNAATDLVDQLDQALAVYPIRIEEAKSRLDSAAARLDMAELALERTVVVAPFDGRVKMVSIEKNQHVTPGMPVLTLADDSVLEISVPLDSREARRWLRFNGERTTPDAAWFSKLEPVTCRIYWTEDDDGAFWEGTLDRVEKFDETTRTLTVAVRIDGAHAVLNGPGRLPLVEGMFCRIEIPGRLMKGVYRLPRWAVSFEQTIYMSVNDRLQTVRVDVERAQGESVYISGDAVKSGDVVIVTRLVNPLENTLLDVFFSSDEVAAL